MNLLIEGMFIVPSILTISYFLFRKNQLIIIIGSLLLPILFLITNIKLSEFNSEEGNLFLWIMIAALSLFVFDFLFKKKGGFNFVSGITLFLIVFLNAVLLFIGIMTHQ